MVILSGVYRTLQKHVGVPAGSETSSENCPECPSCVSFITPLLAPDFRGIIGNCRYKDYTSHFFLELVDDLNSRLPDILKIFDSPTSF